MTTKPPFALKSVLAAFALLLAGCSKVDGSKLGGVRQIDMEGCQYLVIENSFTGAENYAIAFTHKGNCTNPIHKK